MSNSSKALPLVALMFMACEDGPTQPYSPSPDGADQKWNDGQTPPVTDDGKQGFGTQNGGTNKQEICTGEQKAKIWGNMVLQPIKPPTTAAGLDISGGDSWNGMTIEEAEQKLCQSVNYGDAFGDGSQVNYWGDNGEVWAEYRVSTRKILSMFFWPGYQGKVEPTTRDGMHKYSIPVGSQMSKDGKPFSLDWTDPPKFTTEVNDIYDAILSTFSPGLPQDPNCFASGGCIKGNFGDVGYIYFPAIGSAFWVDSYVAPQPVPSTFQRLDMYLAKILPFALSNPMLKLDQEGPISNAGLLGKATSPCILKMGQTYDNFLKTCVSVTGDSMKDQTELNKLLGGLAHGRERFSFDVQGVDLNFSDAGLPPDQIIKDKDKPSGDDVASQWTLDQSTLGKIANDRVGNDPTKPRDLHGAGLVYMEYARLVQDALSSYLDPAIRHELGDPACLFNPATNSGVDPVELSFPDGCTGFEGFVTAAPPGTGTAKLDKLALGLKAAQVVHPPLILGLKPGHPASAFCLDANGDLDTGYFMCNAPAGAQGDIFSTSFARVVQVMGKGKVTNLPNDVRDVRFFWKQYFTALVKYFKAAGTADETVAGVHKQIVDKDNLFFDSLGAGQFELGEYVDRRYASKTQPPLDIVIDADVKNGIFNGYEFSRETFRGEEALYAATLEDQNHGLGQENTALLTNLFGSPVLKSGWTESSAGKSAYYCATHKDPGKCDGQLPPLDQKGNMLLNDLGQALLTQYPGAFAKAGTSFTLGQTPVKIKKLYPEIESAMIDLPRTIDPYDPNTPKVPSLQLLIPWFPKQPGVGFPIAISGTLDKFVTTAQFDFSGTTISANVDYDIAIDPKTMQPYKDGSLEFKAVETTDFLGEVFICQDDVTGELLHVRMYTPAAEIIDWLAAHPAQYAKCGIIITYSPYNNFVDFVTSLKNGVRLGITQGGGFGRVVDVTLFEPGQ